MIERPKSRPITSGVFERVAEILRLENGSGNLVQISRPHSWPYGGQYSVPRGEYRIEHLLLSAVDRSHMIRSRHVRPVPVGVAMTSQNHQVSLLNFSRARPGIWSISGRRVWPRHAIGKAVAPIYWAVVDKTRTQWNAKHCRDLSLRQAI